MHFPIPAEPLMLDIRNIYKRLKWSKIILIILLCHKSSIYNEVQDEVCGFLNLNIKHYRNFDDKWNSPPDTDHLASETGMCVLSAHPAHHDASHMPLGTFRGRISLTPAARLLEAYEGVTPLLSCLASCPPDRWVGLASNRAPSCCWSWASWSPLAQLF